MPFKKSLFLILTLSLFLYPFTRIGADAVPTLLAISPSSSLASDTDIMLTIQGSGFSADAKVFLNSLELSASPISPNELKATVPAFTFSSPGNYEITVQTGSGTSQPKAFTVTSPTPTIDSITPTTTLAGKNSFTLTVEGSHFIAGSMVRFNNQSRTTRLISPNQLQADIPSSDILVSGNYQVIVTNPLPGGGASTPKNFTVTSPVPSIESITPEAKLAGDGTFSLMINGDNFIPAIPVLQKSGSIAYVNDVPLQTVYRSKKQLLVTILANFLKVSAKDSVKVVNPAPGGGASNIKLFFVNNPEPILSGISPTSAESAGNNLLLKLIGYHFTENSVVKFNDQARQTTFTSPSELEVTLLPSDIILPGDYSITVTNPLPGGGTSQPKAFTVTSPTPTIDSITPTTTLAGKNSFTLTVEGSHFIAGSMVRFNNQSRTTRLISPNQLQADIPSSDILVSGNYQVIVTNPLPGGGASTPKNFTVTSPVPSIESITPEAVTMNSQSLFLTIYGINFSEESTVSINGSPVESSNFSAGLNQTGRITTLIDSTKLLKSGVLHLSVTNPAPGGGISNQKDFNILATLINYTYHACYLKACREFSSPYAIQDECTQDTQCAQ